jgi:hypothetical protein
MGALKMLKIFQSETRKGKDKLEEWEDNIEMNLENIEYESVGRI